MRFAKMVGRSQGNISQLITGGRVLPAEHVLLVESQTGISRHDLRPDLYPRENPTDDRLEGVRA